MRRSLMIGVGGGCLALAGGAILWNAQTIWSPPSKEFSTNKCHASAIQKPIHPRGSDWPFEQWEVPKTQPLRLVDMPAEIKGTPLKTNEALRLWTQDQLLEWETETSGDQFRLISPLLPKWKERVLAIQLVIEPQDLSSLKVVISPTKKVEKTTRKHRSLDFRFDGNLGVVTLQADVTDVLSGNWNDEKSTEQTLKRIEISGKKARFNANQLVEVRLLGEDAPYRDQFAASKTVDINGELRPSWYTHGGTSVGFDIKVPENDSELRWYDGNIGGPNQRVVEISSGTGTTELVRLGPSEGWDYQAQDLSPWAGQAITLTLKTEGPGIGVFGNPKLAPATPAPNTPNIIVYMVDTLRADHLHSWGSPLDDVSPNIDHMAEKGGAFLWAQSSSPWTKPAIPTLLTGIWPTTHKVGSIAYTDRLPKAVPTLQKLLGDQGYRTGSFSASPLGSTLSGLEEYFEVAMPPRRWRGELGPLKHASAKQLHQAALQWIDEESDQPFFAYIHTMEVHGWRRKPYKRPPEGFESYDFSIQDADRKLGELISELRSKGLEDNTLIVFTSDHGESFGDHGVKDHGSSLFQSQIHIPLIFYAGQSLPNILVNDPVSLADIAPTILEFLGMEGAKNMDGQSLTPYFNGTQPVQRAFLPSMRIRYLHQAKDPKIFSLTTPNHQKYIKQRKRYEYIFDLAKDPCEGQVAGGDLDRLRKVLNQWIRDQQKSAKHFQEEYGSPTSGTVTASDVQMLKEMGYLE